MKEILLGNPLCAVVKVHVFLFLPFVTHEKNYKFTKKNLRKLVSIPQNVLLGGSSP